MKIEINDENIDLVIVGWLKECVEMSKLKHTEEDDIAFWNELREKCEWILEHNYYIQISG